MTRFSIHMLMTLNMVAFILLSFWGTAQSCWKSMYYRGPGVASNGCSVLDTLSNGKCCPQCQGGLTQDPNDACRCIDTTVSCPSGKFI